MKLLSLTALLVMISSAGWARDYMIPVVPSPYYTPGDLCSEDDRDFLNFRYNEQMPYCERNVWSNLKNRIYDVYEIPDKCRHRYTIDHLIPLALGGNNSFQNLWPEHVLVKATRQALENELYRKVNAGQMSSEDAVQFILRVKNELELDLSHVNGCG